MSGMYVERVVPLGRPEDLSNFLKVNRMQWGKVWSSQVISCFCEAYRRECRWNQRLDLMKLWREFNAGTLYMLFFQDGGNIFGKRSRALGVYAHLFGVQSAPRVLDQTRTEFPGWLPGVAFSDGDIWLHSKLGRLQHI